MSNLNNPYLHFYRSKVGGGLSSYEGSRRRQTGRGWWSDLGAQIMPMLRYLGNKVYKFGSTVISDLKEGKPILDTLKKRGLESVSEVAHDIGTKAKEYAQSGSGVRSLRRRKNTSRKLKKVYKPPTVETIAKGRKKTQKKITFKIAKPKSRKKN